MKEIEQDGFATWYIGKPLEQTGKDTARHMTECIYPQCELCNKYVGSACAVPMVITKQQYIMNEEWKQRVLEKLSEHDETLAYMMERTSHEVLDV